MSDALKKALEALKGDDLKKDGVPTAKAVDRVLIEQESELSRDEALGLMDKKNPKDPKKSKGPKTSDDLIKEAKALKAKEQAAEAAEVEKNQSTQSLAEMNESAIAAMKKRDAKARKRK